ncbi:MAG TPA: peptidoglycan editing factor PgeF [Nitrosospira sp.]
MHNDWIVPDWPAPHNVRALFTTRNGGASGGPYASLNLGDHVGDDPLNVEKNRSLLRQILPAEPAWLKQVHGPVPVNIDDDCRMGVCNGDAAFSHRPGNVCAVLVADCLPILVCDRVGTVAGVIHAGWRGLAGGVIERTLTEAGAGNMRMMAWLGPAIGPSHFEVGEEVHEAFIKHDAKAAMAFVPHPHHDAKWFADLFMLARQRLTEAGVDEIYGGGQCTFSDPARFFSYRRDGTTGRMAALIWLAG